MGTSWGRDGDELPIAERLVHGPLHHFGLEVAVDLYWSVQESLKSLASGPLHRKPRAGRVPTRVEREVLSVLYFSFADVELEPLGDPIGLWRLPILHHEDWITGNGLALFVHGLEGFERVPTKRLGGTTG